MPWLDGAIELAVPTHWVFEVGNVLGLKQPAQASALLQAVRDLLLPEESPATYAAGIFDLMRRLGATRGGAVRETVADRRN